MVGNTPERVPGVLDISVLYQGWLRQYAPDLSYVEAYPMGSSAPLPMAHVHQAQEVFNAPSSNQEGETIPYVRVGAADTGERPILFVPGFTAGIEAKLPFALGMAKRRGVEVILPGQNRAGIAKNLNGKKDATFTQASNVLDVLWHTGLAEKPGSVDVVTHSYGSLIFEGMTKIATANGFTCFEGANVAMMAPAGLNHFENPLALGLRFARGFKREGPMKKDIFDENYYQLLAHEMFIAGKKTAMENKARTIREAWELSSRRLDITALRRFSGIGSLAILPFAQDDVFPARAQRRMMERAFAVDQTPDGKDLPPLTWATPISLQGKDGEPIRGGRDAGHNDDQNNPARASGAVFQVLRPAKTLHRVDFREPR